MWCGIDPCHSHIPLSALLPSSSDGGGFHEPQRCTIYLDGGQWQTGFWFGLEVPTEELGFRLLKAQLQRKSLLAYEVYHDLSMLIEWVEYTYEKEGIPLNTENGYYEPIVSAPPSLRRMLYLLNQACDTYDQSEQLTELRDKIQYIYQQLTTPPDYNRMNMKICHVGHAHMDLVWLWPERVTYKKITHTFSNVLQLMDRYPEFTFTMSQPPLYYHIKEKEPEMVSSVLICVRQASFFLISYLTRVTLFVQAAKIADKMKGGQWEFTGALEVEADTQIPVGEGLVRCILYGQERIKQVRGKKSDTVWIPDCFGYTQCLPQLFSLSDIPNFFTTKILWSTVTKFPHNSFVWIGADGESSVLAHLSVAGYNGQVTMKESMLATRNYSQADVHNEVLSATGYGDGGGGPNEDQIERSMRMKRSFGGQTPTCQWGTVDSFFQRLSLVKEDLPVFRGELYLEYHRAVHTTQSNFKYNLRYCERALQTREAMRVIGANYRPLDMKESWERYLFALFHDATPGSSIHTVYQELNRELCSLAERQVQSAIDEWPRLDTLDDDNMVVVVNPLPCSRTAVLEIPADVLPTSEASLLLCSTEDGNNNGYPMQLLDGQAYACVDMKGLCSIPFHLTTTAANKRPRISSPSLSATPTSLDNGVVHADFDEYGQLRAMSVHGKQLLLSNDESASFALHKDNPEAYDAWDMDHHIVWMKENAIKETITLSVHACGPVLSMLRSDPIHIGQNGSTIVIEYSLHAYEDSLRVGCSVDWKEKHKTLRYQIPTQYRGDVARFGAPFNFVDRVAIPQGHKEEAQWEVPGSRWASVLDGSMSDGLSIITQSKYGFRAKQGTLSLTLLRSSTEPDPKADEGKHKVQFAITRHRNEYSNYPRWSPTAAKADELYTPLVVLTNSSSKAATSPPIEFTSLGSVVVSWVMPSNTVHGYCIRLHETAGINTEIEFKLASDAVVRTVNFNERVLGTLEPLEMNSYLLEVTASKIVTIQVEISR